MKWRETGYSRNMKMRLPAIPHVVVVLFLSVILATELWMSARRIIIASEDEAITNVSFRPTLQEMQAGKTVWNLPIPSDSKEIRRWGCNRTETPLIFVHIGKAGGGSVAARLEASSLNFTRTRHNQNDDSYYPVSQNVKARFAASHFCRHLPNDEHTFEGTDPCHSSTPIGQAIGCPETLSRYRRFAKKRHGECDPFSDSCHILYSGHNFLGSELHWLPVRYLQRWWASLSNKPNEVTPLFDKLLRQETWCKATNESRPKGSASYKRDYEECSIPLQREVDAKAIHLLTQQLGGDNSRVITSWSPIYASLPVLRVTVMRDPFSWLVSKYFWHLRDHHIESGSTCDDLENAILWNNTLPGRSLSSSLGLASADPGWISRMALGYIMYLCGEDCIVRYAAGTATLADVEKQAENNLRQAFAVVGLLEEVDTFYEMISARVQYIDTSLNPEVKGSKHSTGSSKETQRCRALFQEPDFQAELLASSAELRALNRLYHVGKEVNRFQLQELQTCSPER